MKIVKLLPLLALAACADNTATKQQSVQIFAAASTALTSAQSKAVDQAKATHLVKPTDVTLDYTGPCTLGGSLGLNGSYSGDSNTDHAVFDLTTAFNGCHEVAGTLDGSLHWTSEATATGFTAGMNGALDWTDNDGTVSCNFDLALAIDQTGVRYDGHLCGYDVKTELTIGH